MKHVKRILVIFECSNEYLDGSGGHQWEETEIYDIPLDKNVSTFGEELQKEIYKCYLERKEGRRDILSLHEISYSLYPVDKNKIDEMDDGQN
jgi:hypothetical protein